MSNETRYEYDVFISYSDADIERVSDFLIPMLCFWSLKIWWDHIDLLPVQRLDELTEKTQNDHITFRRLSFWLLDDLGIAIERQLVELVKRKKLL